MMTNDTICAVSTAPGVGGIAVIRVSGPRAIETIDRHWSGRQLSSVQSHTAHLGTINDTDGQPLDQCVATVFRAPHSFTGDDVVELSVHGSRWVQRCLLDLLTESGCRLAEPGEFTRRAFISGKMDLAEAEAVADVIASNSRAAHRIAVNQMRGGFSRRLASLREQLLELTSLLELELDFSEEDVEFASRQRLIDIAREIQREVTRLHQSFTAGAAIKDGIPVAIVGATNAGKSSLLNAILGDDRAIVSDIHGTTRDTIEETIELGDYQFRFIDTAGLRDTSDEIERIGIQRSRQAIDRARIVIFVTDSTLPIDIDEISETTHANDDCNDNRHIILALNKSDLPDSRTEASPIGLEFNTVHLSAKTGAGIDTLRDTLIRCADTEAGNADEDILVTNARHAQALGNAARSIARVTDGLTTGLPGDLIAQDLRETLTHLGEITGDISTTDILTTIFSRFCVGK